MSIEIRRAVRSLALLLSAAAIVATLAPAAVAQKVLAPGFQVELIYRPPNIEHPSVVTCDDEGNLFVGEDPMDMRGPTTKHIDRIIYIRWDKETGQPIRTVFAENLAAVFGMVWHDGALYVMHAPLYSVFRDTTGDGVADQRQDLAHGFGPPAGVYGFNDHIVTGTRLGMDGYVYVSVGDKGIPQATGADGGTISLEGGGVVRMKLDGTQLEVVSSGTRNHLDVAMDSLDNIFTYDNTDDGLGWWTRFTHHIPSGFYGYPYHFLTKPERHLPIISDHGGGSPVGAACYRQAAWPEKYRDAAFHCEWGKQKVQVFYPRRSGATFTATMEDFLVPDGSGEPFRPLDLCFSPDGRHMYLADWNFGGWVNPTICGRLYRVTYVGDDVEPEPPRAANAAPLAEQLRSLGHPAHSERMRAQHQLTRLGRPAADAVAPVLADANRPKLARVHAIWTQHAVAEQAADYDPAGDWRRALAGDVDPDVRSQAARAMGTRRTSDSASIAALTAALDDGDAAVRMWASIALGRIGARPAVERLFRALGDDDPFARFAAIQALRAIGDWSPAQSHLAGDDAALRRWTVVALAEQYHPQAAGALAWAVEHGADETTRADALAALAEVHRRADPYKQGWWGTQPAKGQPARPKVHAWEATELVLSTLRGALHHRDGAVRRAAMKALTEIKDAAAVPAVAAIARDRQVDGETRTYALQMLLGAGAGETAAVAAAICGEHLAPAALAVQALTALRQLQAKDHLRAVEARLDDPAPAVRVAALSTLAAMAGAEATPRVVAAIASDDAELRPAALRLVGEAQLRGAVPAAIEAAATPALFAVAADALTQVPDRRALGVYLQALASQNAALRGAARGALIAIKGEIGDEIVARHERRELSPEVRRELQTVFSAPQPIRQWQLLGAFEKNKPQPEFDLSQSPDLNAAVASEGRMLRWKQVNAKDEHGRIDPADHVRPSNNVWAWAYAEVRSTVDQMGAVVVGSDDQARVYVNGQKVYEHLGDRGWSPQQGEGPAPLRTGVNHIWFQTGNSSGPWQFSLQLRVKSAEYGFLYEDTPPQLDISAYRQFALNTPGDAARGERLFVDLEGVGCVKCHAVAGKGSKIGPDLVGIGAKYPRDELIRSVLEPSARVAESYQATQLITVDGKVLSGLVQREDEQEIELADTAGKLFVVAKADIEERRKSGLSLMPNGLNEGLSLADFADIIAYLASLQENAPAGP